MIDTALFTNLSGAHSAAERMQCLVSAMRRHFKSDAVALLRLQDKALIPDAVGGLLQVHAGEPLPVHDCMGVSLTVDGQLWGALTLDALGGDRFGAQRIAELRGPAGNLGRERAVWPCARCLLGRQRRPRRAL